jgi:hypothetical protein
MRKCTAAVVAVLLASGGAAHASAPEEVVDVKDPRGDVRIYPTNGLTLPARKSIGLTSFAAQRDGRRLRAVFSMARVMTSPDWDQMFFVAMEPPRNSTDTWLARFGATTKGRAYSFWAADSDSDQSAHEYCRASVTVRRARAELVVDVPWRCIPTGPTRIRVGGSTGHYETDAPPFSHDTLRVPGSVTLQD